MSVEPRRFLDTNILVYAFDTAAPASKRQTAQHLVEAAILGDGLCCSAQVLSEFFVTVTRKGTTLMASEQARDIVGQLRPICLVDIDAALVLRGIEVHCRYQTSYWDGLIIAAAERAGCSQILSEDLSHGQEYVCITVLNPFADA
jgi:predicted nucleic acid-binding protein